MYSRKYPMSQSNQRPISHNYNLNSFPEVYREPYKTRFTTEEAYEIGDSLGIDWENNPFDIEQYRMGLDVELEHGKRNPGTNTTDDDPIVTGKIALVHLSEFPDYYTRLAKLEEEARTYWGIKEI